MPRTVAWAPSVSVALILLAGPARAQEGETIAILDLRAGPDGEAFAGSMTQALRRVAATVPGWRVVDAAALSGQACETNDGACLAAVAGATSASRVVAGSVAKQSETMVVSLVMLARGAPRPSAPAEERVPLAESSDADLEGTAEALLARLAGDAFQPAAAGEESDAGAEPEVEEPAGATQTRASFDIRAAAVEERAGAPSHGGPPWDDARTPIGIGLVATGGALLVAGIYTAVQIGTLEDDPQYESFRERVPRGYDVCDELDAGNTWGASAEQAQRAGAVCDEGKSLSVLAWVFLGGAVAAGAAGAAVLFLGGDGDEVAMRPTVGLRGAGLTADVVF